MKKLVLGLVMFLFVSKVHALDRQTQPDFFRVATMTVVGTSISSWTLVSVTTSVFKSGERIAHWIDHAPNNTQNVLLGITTAPAAPPTTSYGYTLKPADQPWVLSLDSKIYIWAIADGQPQQLIIQEFK